MEEDSASGSGADSAEPDTAIKMSDMEEDSASGSGADSAEPKKEKKVRRKKRTWDAPRMTKAEWSRMNKANLKRAKRDKRREIIKAHLASTASYHVKCKRPVDDEIFDVDEYVKYLKERFKSNGKTGCVGPDNTVQITKSA